MAYVPFQESNPKTYSPVQALEAGTVFPELNKPFYGNKCGGVKMTEREILLKKISTYQFSILDLQIFLDTHPYDQQVLSQIKECKEKLLPLIEEYEEKYGPLRKEANTANKWQWVKNPWPWDNEEDL